MAQNQNGAVDKAVVAKMGHEEAALATKLSKRKFAAVRPHRWRRVLPGHPRGFSRERLSRAECPLDSDCERTEDESDLEGENLRYSRLEESMRDAESLRNVLFETIVPANNLSADEIHEAFNTIIFATKANKLLMWCRDLALRRGWPDADDAEQQSSAFVPVYSGGKLYSPKEVALFLVTQWLMHWDGGTKLRLVPETKTLLREIIDICEAQKDSFEVHYAEAALEAAEAATARREHRPEEPQDDFQGTPRSAGVSVDSISASAEADLMSFLDAESARRGSAVWFGLSSPDFAAERLSMERRCSVASWASAQSLDSAHTAASLGSPRKGASSPKNFKALLQAFRLRGSSQGEASAAARDVRLGLLAQLIRLRPADAALQLTLLVQDTICNEIKVFELGRAVRAGRVRAAPCPNLNRLVSVFEVVASWVETDVLAHAHRNTSSRVRALVFFLRVAVACRELRSFHLLFALVAGLGQSTLTWVWTLAPAKERASFEKLQRVVSPRQNYLVYRADLSKSPVPDARPSTVGCMPFLGIWLKDASVMLEINATVEGCNALSAYSAYALGREAILCQRSYAACPRDEAVREMLCALLQFTTINADFKAQLSSHELRRSSPRFTAFLSRKGLSSPAIAIN